MSETKQCRKCGISKPLCDFQSPPPSKPHGYSRCRACMNETIRIKRQNSAEFRAKRAKDCLRWREKNPEHVLAYRKTYETTNREARLAMQRIHSAKYRKLPGRKEEHNRAVKRYLERHPERHKARMKVMIELRAGRMTRQPCQICGEPKTQAHHDDYSKPLDVRWLCVRHHGELSRKRPDAA